MKKEKTTTIGIICEYNPFHNGHLYHLQKIREIFPNSLIILVLNGYFCERGEISIINKKDKTLIALKTGVDIVVELPFVFGTQSADTFANAAITYLEALKCQYVVFGSESNDLTKLHKITDYIINNESYNFEVKKYLKEGLNYPTSLAKALNTDFEFKPNDLLGISYIKSIKKNNYKIKPMTIKRTNDYLDILDDSNIISASNIRNKLKNEINISKYVPVFTLQYIKKIDLDAIFPFIKYKIITEKDLSIYLDVDEGIEHRIKKIIYNVSNIDELITQIKSKRYTYNKIKRMLIHILIGFTKEDNTNLKIEYIKILGFNMAGRDYLKQIKKEVTIPTTPIKNSLIYKYEQQCALIYDMITYEKNSSFEKSNKPIKFF